MEPCERKSGESQLPVLDAVPSTASKPALRLSAQQRQELEFLYRQCPRPSSALLQHLIKDSPSLANLDIHLLKAWFHSRRFKERRDEKLSPLINKNAELKGEHDNLLLLNNQLRSQTLLLNLENQRLKEQLELQLQLKRAASSPKIPPLEVEKEGYCSDVDDGDSGPRESGISDLESNLCKVKLHE